MADEQGDFDPIALRARLAERDEHFAEFLDHPLYRDKVAASSPGWTEWHAYRGLPADEQNPPGLTSADFAKAYRDVPHPAGILDRKRVNNGGVDDQNHPPLLLSIRPSLQASGIGTSELC